MVLRYTVEMLFPPGIKNEGNICFASSVLQCLLNQKVFVEALDKLHEPLCSQCQFGMYTLNGSIYHSYIHMPFLPCPKYDAGSCGSACGHHSVITELHNIRRAYSYRPRPRVVSSSGILTKLAGNTAIM